MKSASEIFLKVEDMDKSLRLTFWGPTCIRYTHTRQTTVIMAPRDRYSKLGDCVSDSGLRTRRHPLYPRRLSVTSISLLSVIIMTHDLLGR